MVNAVPKLVPDHVDNIDWRENEWFDQIVAMGKSCIVVDMAGGTDTLFEKPEFVIETAGIGAAVGAFQADVESPFLSRKKIAGFFPVEEVWLSFQESMILSGMVTGRFS